MHNPAVPTFVVVPASILMQTSPVLFVVTLEKVSESVPLETVTPTANEKVPGDEVTLTIEF